MSTNLEHLNAIGGKVVSAARAAGALTKFAALAGLAVVAGWLSPRLTTGPGHAPAAAALTAPAGQTTVTFTVGSATRTKTGLLFLNDTPDYRNATTTVVGKGPAFAAVDPAAFKGRTVSVTGVAGSYRGKPQVEITDPSQIAVR